MKLRQIYQKDINRDINGVIKADQLSETFKEQELSEYIVTKELRKHFTTLINNYSRSLEKPTDKIGVWISGFFGSGKSHFLKVLYYLFSNQTANGKKAIDFFKDKFNDPLLYSELEQCVKVPTETIYFNIDSKGSSQKDSTAILKVFTKAFYDHLGFCGDDLKIAKLEQFITKSGKMPEFKAKFKEVMGESWDNKRSDLGFFEDEMVEILQKTLGMSETAAKNWFNGTETADISIEQLVKEIKAYIDSKGNEFRLLFMVDEMGQYIGSDGSLMLNLQTIVEDIGSVCEGRVWVFVTSQEAIDSVTKIKGDDFSKIQGRFNTRLSLSSSSVEEVIKKRILAKTEDAKRLLELDYAKDEAVLRNLFTFSKAILDLKGYSGSSEFAESYPFVPYQFQLMQTVFAEIRKHGNSGKNLSGGERSMLSGFQEAAQVLNEKEINALVPFNLFYNTVHTFLESTIRQVIDRCQKAADNHDGIEPYDVEVLKLLYLIRYVDDLPANLENISTLMIDDIQTDKITLRKKITESLNRLLDQHYIALNGDKYSFLTDDEQEIEREIGNTPIDSAIIIKEISNTIFNDIYPSKKFRYGEYDFPYCQIIDDTYINQLPGAISLHIITEVADANNYGEERLKMNSGLDKEAIFVLSKKYHYFEDIDKAAKIRRYISSRNILQLPESIRSIIRSKQQQAESYEKDAKAHLTAALLDAKMFVAGDNFPKRTNSVKDNIDAALGRLVANVYTKLNDITHNFQSDEELRYIVENENQQLSTDGSIAVYNPAAVKDISEFLELKARGMLPVSMGDIQRKFSGIPYGWKEIDIAATVLSLVAKKDITIVYSGNTIQPSDKNLIDYLRRRNEIDKTMIKQRVSVPASLIKQARDFLKDYFNTMDLPDDEDGLLGYTNQKFVQERDKFQNLLSQQYSIEKYPGKDVVTNGLSLCQELLNQKRDNVAFLQKMVDLKEKFLDLNEDMTDVNSFFSNQKGIFDDAYALADQMNKERVYLQASDEATDALNQINEIIKDEKPYRRIKDLPELEQKIRKVYQQSLELKRSEVNSEIQAAMAEIHQSAGNNHDTIVVKADTAFTEKKDYASKADTITNLDAMRLQIKETRQQYLKAIVVKEDSNVKSSTLSREAICEAANLKDAGDVDKYVDNIKEKLLDKLKDSDVIHII